MRRQTSVYRATRRIHGRTARPAHTLIDDVPTDLRQAMDIGLTGAVIATFDRVIEQAIDAVAVVAIVFRGVDAPWAAMLWARRGLSWPEAFDLIPQLGERRGGGGSGKA